MLDTTTLEMYPFTGKTLDRGGLRYHYLDEGTGDAPVFQGAQINDYHSVCISHEKPLQLFIWRG